MLTLQQIFLKLQHFENNYKDFPHIRSGTEPSCTVAQTRSESRMAHHHTEPRLATLAFCLPAETRTHQHPRSVAEGEYQHRPGTDTRQGIDHLPVGHRALGRLYDGDWRNVAWL